jgi:hypothetical protein
MNADKQIEQNPAILTKPSFTVSDVKQLIAKLGKNNTFTTMVLDMNTLATACILCKFMVQGIRAHGIFKDLSKIPFFNGYTERNQLGKLITLYDSVKYRVFNNDNCCDGVFTPSCIKHVDTTFDIPFNFLSSNVPKGYEKQTGPVISGPNYNATLSGSVKISMRRNILNLLRTMYFIFTSSNNNGIFTTATSKNNEIEYLTDPKKRVAESTEIYNFTADASKTARTTLSKLITEKCQKDENVKYWYIQWSLIFKQLFGEMPFFPMELKNDETIPLTTEVGRVDDTVPQAGGKSRRARTKRAARGSTKRKQRKHRKATQRKQRKQHKQRK